MLKLVQFDELEGANIISLTRYAYPVLGTYHYDFPVVNIYEISNENWNNIFNNNWDKNYMNINRNYIVIQKYTDFLKGQIYYENIKIKLHFWGLL